MFDRIVGELSTVPYAEPTWLSAGYYSPYFKEVNEFRWCGLTRLTWWLQTHREFQRAVRRFVDEVVYPDAQVLHPETRCITVSDSSPEGQGRGRKTSKSIRLR